MNAYEKTLGVVGVLLWVALIVALFAACSPTPAEIEWDRCYQSVNPETGAADVTYCTKDTVFHSP